VEQELRSETPRYRATVYAILVAGVVPVLLPCFWLVSSSLKPGDRVFAATPEWLPRVVGHWVDPGTGGGPLWVSVIDTQEEAATGVWTVKPVPPPASEERAVAWPVAQLAIEEQPRRTTLWRGRRVPLEELGTTDTGLVLARLIGVHPEEDVAVREVEMERRRRVFLEFSRARVEVAPDPAGASGLHSWVEHPPIVRRALAALPRSPERARIAVQLWGASPFLRWMIGQGWGGGPLPLLLRTAWPGRVVDVAAAAGWASVQLEGEPGDPLLLPAAALTGEEETCYWTNGPGGARVPVEWVHRTREGETGRVRILDREVETELARGAIREETERRLLAMLFGLKVRVQESRDDAGTTPPGTMPVRFLEPVPLAADRVRSHNRVAPQWQNYARAVRREPFHLYIVNTLFITACCILGQVLSCSLVGYAFARLRFRGRDLLFLVLLSAMMLPSQVTMIPTFVLFTRLGWLDSFRPLIVPAWFAQSAFFVFLYRQFFMAIPVDLEDAARVDGCSPLGTWWHIMMPMAAPAVVTVAVYTFMGSWNDFLGPLLYINSEERQTLALGLQNFKTSFGYEDPHFLLAASTMMIAPSVLIFFLAQKAFMRGVVVSGVKG